MFYQANKNLNKNSTRDDQITITLNTSCARMKKAQSTEFNSMFKIHFIDYGKLRLKMGYFEFIVKIAPINKK